MTLDIREILEQLWIDCNNTPTDRTIYDPVGGLIEKALIAIDSAFKKWFMETAGEDEDMWGGTYADVQMRIGKNLMRQEIRSKLNETNL